MSRPSITASGPLLDPKEFLECAEAAIFSPRLADAEDQLAIAAEREELRQFLADYEAWLDHQRDTPPSIADYPHLAD